jgi:hypothetical protein
MSTRVALVLVLLAMPSIAAAQNDVLLVTAREDASHADDLHAWVRALRREIATSSPHVLHDSDCWPEQAACAARLTRSSGARQVLFVRILWGRGPCVPMRAASGRATGHRMMRTATLDLLLLDAQGHTIAHQTRPAAIAEADRAAAAAELRAALGVATR